jgi:hypothetical protein
LLRFYRVTAQKKQPLPGQGKYFNPDLVYLIGCLSSVSIAFVASGHFQYISSNLKMDKYGSGCTMFIKRKQFSPEICF